MFVTGGGSGIGESIVEHFSAQGARVTFADIQEDASRALVERIRERGYAAPRFVRCDLKQIDALRDAIDRVGTRGRPDQGAGQQCRQRRPAPDRERLRGLLGRPHRR